SVRVGNRLLLGGLLVGRVGQLHLLVLLVRAAGKVGGKARGADGGRPGFEPGIEVAPEAAVASVGSITRATACNVERGASSAAASTCSTTGNVQGSTCCRAGSYSIKIKTTGSHTGRISNERTGVAHARTNVCRGKSQRGVSGHSIAAQRRAGVRHTRARIGGRCAKAKCGGSQVG